MKWAAVTWVALACCPAAFPEPEPGPSGEILAVVGAPGEPRFDPLFREAAERLRQVAGRGGAEIQVLGLDASEGISDKDALRLALETQPNDAALPLWLVYIGHGAFDGEIATLNLRGPDVNQLELAAWLEPLERPLIVVLGGSSSAPFLPALSSENRVVITATRDGFESSYARFGEAFTRALLGLNGDLDRDGQVSALEAFLKASADVRTFYEQERRLATEHALIDDNGDGLGSPGAWFRGVRPVQRPENADALDGYRAAQLTLIPSPEELALTPKARARRDALELELIQLRDRQRDLDREAYDAALEALILQLMEIYAPTAEPEPLTGLDAPTSPEVSRTHEPEGPTNELDEPEP